MDSLSSGLLLPFDDVFSFTNKEQHEWYEPISEELIGHLNELRAFPGDTQGELLSYDRVKDSSDDFFSLPSHQPLKFDLTGDYPEPVVVYEAMGGGVLSHCFLQRVALHADFATEIKSALDSFPHHYASVHVRQSDLSTDYKRLLATVKDQIADTPVFVASDSDEVIEYAKAIFGAGQLLTLSRKLSRDGHPLHTPTRELSRNERLQVTKEMFVELFAIAEARRFFFGDVTNRSGVSGFSRLAAFLARNPQVRGQLLSSPDTHRKKRPGRVHHVASIQSQIAEKTRWLLQKNCR